MGVLSAAPEPACTRRGLSRAICRPFPRAVVDRGVVLDGDMTVANIYQPLTSARPGLAVLNTQSQLLPPFTDEDIEEQRG